MSIWKGINRAAFEANLANLHQIAPTQKCEGAKFVSKLTQSVISSNSSSGSKGLPASVEEQLSKDFAFLAAWESSPNCVTAATVVASESPHGVTVTLAANEGIAACVVEAFTQILQLLKDCALRLISRQTCASDCLDIILGLHRNRIRERLGFNNTRVDKRWAPRQRVSIADRLQKMDQVHGTTGDRRIRDTLLAQIEDLKHAIQHLETASENESGLARVVVEAASAIVSADEPLNQRLKKAGYEADFARRQEIRQIKALANYVRSCHYIVRAARSYQYCFSDTRLVPLPSYPPEYWPAKSKNKHFVHAEIQLLVHHDTNLSTGRPRHIGVSKKACFLCYCFMRAHGRYSITETHGEVHPQWTVPDKSDYTVEERNRLKKALKATEQSVHRALENARTTKSRNGPLVQSAVNSVVASLKSASLSTLTRRDSAAPTDENRSEHEAALDDNSENAMEASMASSSSILSTDTDSTLTEHHGTFDCRIRQGCSSIVSADWLTLYVTLNSGPRTPSSGEKDASGCPQIDAGRICKVSTTPQTSSPQHGPVINVAHLEPNRILSFEEPVDQNGMSFRFVEEQQEHIDVRFAWT